jgi:hypothetical protein
MTEKVTTWANGYGLWHARVTLSEPYGPSALAAEIDRIRAKARRAIKSEIRQRQSVQNFRCAIQIVDKDLDHMNVTRSITFAEVTND